MSNASRFIMVVFLALATRVAEANVTAFFSTGTSCSGPPAAIFRSGGPEFKVTLCLTATEESLCGHSIQLEAESSAASGRFQVVAHAMGTNYPDPTLEKRSTEFAITQPASMQDFGGTRDNPTAPAANQVLATFTLRALATAKDKSYEIRLGKNSLVSVAKDGTCLQNTEVPISARLTLNRQ